MSVSVRRILAAALVGLAVLGWTASKAGAYPIVPSSTITIAQPVNPNFQVAPGLTLSQYAYNTAVMGHALRQVPPYALGYNPYQAPIGYGAAYPAVGVGGYGTLAAGAYTPSYGGSATLTTNPYGLGDSANTPSYTPPYMNPYLPSYSDPYSGGLYGTADITRAAGQFLKDNQQARITQVQAEMARLDLRRRLAEEARYERMNIPSTEELRQQEMKRDLERARNNPPVGEILSGKALNDLTRHLEDVQSKGSRGPNVQLDDDTLRHINVVAPSSKGGNVGLLLKDDGKLSWPPALLGSEFKETRAALSTALETAVQQIKFKNPLEPGNLKDLNADWKKLNDLVQKSELSPTDYIDARQYLEQVRDAVTALNDPNVANYFNQTWSAKGKTVAELIDNMKGLDFAPAAPGDEVAYRRLHQALAAYDYGMAPLSPREKDKP